MGLDVRDIPKKAAVSLPDHFRTSGFEVSVVRKPHHRLPEITVTFVSCCRDRDTQVVFWCEEPNEQVWRAYISAAWGWRFATRARRQCLRADVTAALEAAGGYFPTR